MTKYEVDIYETNEGEWGRLMYCETYDTKEEAAQDFSDSARLERLYNYASNMGYDVGYSCELYEVKNGDYNCLDAYNCTLPSLYGMTTEPKRYTVVETWVQDDVIDGWHYETEQFPTKEEAMRVALERAHEGISGAEDIDYCVGISSLPPEVIEYLWWDSEDQELPLDNCDVWIFD